MGWLPILKLVLGPVFDYLKQRSEDKKAEAKRDSELKEAIHKRQVSLMEQGLAADANWEMEFARQAATSWKDEYTLVVVSIPLILGFLPGMVGYVEAGFKAFAQAPLWYQIMTQAMFYATVGMRMFRRNQSDT